MSLLPDTPAAVMANWVDAARDGLAELNTPAPCGHNECTEQDAELLKQTKRHAEHLASYVGAFEVDPEAAVRVFAVLDTLYIMSAADTNSSIPSYELHCLLLATAVALTDQAQTPDVPAQEADTKEVVTSGSDCD